MFGARLVFARCGWAALSVVVALAITAPTYAQDTRVAVLDFKGAGSAKVRGALVGALRANGVTIVEKGELESAARRLGADLGEASARADLSRMYAVDAFVEGSVERERGENVVTFTVSDGGSGESLDVVSLSARNPKLLAKLVRRDGWDTLSSSIGRARRGEQEAAPATTEAEAEPEPEAEPERKAEPEPEEEAEEEEEEEDEGDDADDGERPSPLRLEIGAGGFARDLEYRENADRLPGYDIALPPAARLLAIWYPAAHFSDSVPAHIGLRLTGQYAFGLSSKLEAGGGPEFSTSSLLFEVGLRGRIPLDDFEIGLSFSYGSHSYAIDPAREAGIEIPPGIPSAGYSYLHIGTELRLQLGDLALGFGGAFMPLLGTGDIEKWFPRASGLGIEGSLELGYAVSSSLELFTLVANRRYAVSFDPQLEDVAAGQPIAGGMVDGYTHVQLGLRFAPGRTP